MLRSTDPLPARPQRIAVAGTSGTGKTTLAKQLAARLDLPHTEIDDVAAFTSTDRWVTEWQYAPAQPVVAARADLLVWLDLPLRTTLRRVVTRTLRRRLRREVLWNGNVEPPLWTFVTDREHIVRWAITTRHRLASDVPALQQVHPLLPVVRLRTASEVARWIARLRGALPLRRQARGASRVRRIGKLVRIQHRARCGDQF